MLLARVQRHEVKTSGGGIIRRARIVHTTPKHEWKQVSTLSAVLQLVVFLPPNAVVAPYMLYGAAVGEPSVSVARVPGKQ